MKGADTSKKIKEYLHHPSANTFKNYVQNNSINNCTVTPDDINRADIIYGPPVPYLQGHMVRRKHQVHDKIQKIPLPPMIAQHHLNIALHIDFFYANENVYFSHKIRQE